MVQSMTHKAHRTQPLHMFIRKQRPALFLATRDRTAETLTNSTRARVRLALIFFSFP